MMKILFVDNRSQETYLADVLIRHSNPPHLALYHSHNVVKGRHTVRTQSTLDASVTDSETG